MTFWGPVRSWLRQSGTPSSLTIFKNLRAAVEDVQAIAPGVATSALPAKEVKQVEDDSPPVPKKWNTGFTGNLVDLHKLYCKTLHNVGGDTLKDALGRGPRNSIYST